ncbi:MAG: hypothetical protein O3C27_13255 [Actinomycetota bacterium]|nr:hypothetical protein [Actinomycetota bacterium]
MTDAGLAGPASTDRRYTNADYIACYENLEHWAPVAESLGFDTMWMN